MSDVIRDLALKAAAARDEGKFSRVSELYDQACSEAPGAVEKVRKTFEEVGITVSGSIPRPHRQSMVFVMKGEIS